MTTTKHACIVVAEGDFEGRYKFDTEAELKAFSEGVSLGANLYGSGSCGAYTLADLGDDNSPELDALIRKYLM